MARYVILMNWTEQGIKTFKDSPSRADAAREAMAGMGVTIGDIYWTLGPYDVVTFVDSPDDDTLTAALLALSSGGNIRTTTMRAFDRSEFDAIVVRAGG